MPGRIKTRRASPNQRPGENQYLGTVDVVVAAGDRLVATTLQLVRQINPNVDAQPDTPQYVADGTFQRLLS
jgi:hypothetical protein